VQWRLDSNNNCPYIFLRPVSGEDGFSDGAKTKFSIIDDSACSTS